MTTTVTSAIAAGDLSGPRAWFTQARFGIFIHFGLYTVHGQGEDHHRDGWTPQRYAQELMPRFNPSDFDAKQWVEQFQQAGARYCVLTSKHGEGFCLWDTDTTDFKATNTPFGRDIVGELADACHTAGLRFGLYFAIDNWHATNREGGESSAASFTALTRRQLEELTTRYGQVDVMWFDGSSPLLPKEQLQQIVDDIRDRQPSIVVNDRGVHHNDTGDQSCGDFVTPERFFPSVVSDDAQFVEICDAMCINYWGWREDNVFWSVPTLLSRLARCASRGANYLVNAEPDASGRIRQACSERLEAIGRWNALHGDVIFNVQSCTVKPVEAYEQNQHALGVCTRGDRCLHLLLDQWPATSRLFLPGVVGEVAAVRCAGQRIDAYAERADDGMHITNLPGVVAGTNPVLTIEWADDPVFAEAENREPVPVKIAADVPSVVPAAKAILLPSNDGVTWHQLERYTNGSESIGRWVRASSRVQWPLDVEAQGSYAVYLYLGTTQPQADTEITLAVGDAKISMRSRETGWYGDAYGFYIGRFELTRGQHRLTLSMKPVRFGPNVHGIVMVPART